MIYQLSETDKACLIILKEKIFLHYKEDDAQILDEIINRAILNDWMSKDDVYELIERLPKIIPMPVEKINDETESHNAEWNVYIDEHKARYRHEMEKLHQILSNWIFLECAVHRKSMEYFEKGNKKVNLNNVGQGIKK